MSLDVKPGAAQAPQTAPIIKATADAKSNIIRTWFGGAILSILTLAYLVALFKKLDGSSALLGLIGPGIGFLLGRGPGSKA